MDDPSPLAVCRLLWQDPPAAPLRGTGNGERGAWCMTRAVRLGAGALRVARIVDNSLVRLRLRLLSLERVVGGL